MENINANTLDLGTIHKGYLTPNLGDGAGEAIEFPYTIIRGATEGKTLLITAGVHGAEYASVEAALRLGELKASELSGTLIILPILNPPSFFARTIYVSPLDNKNLNRVFPGDANGSISERITHWFSTKILPQADAYIDLHGGDMIEALHPFSIYTKGNSSAQEMAHAFGIEHVIGSDSFGASITAAHQLGIPAILPESGGQGIWEEHHITPLVEGCKRIMRSMNILQGDNETIPTTEIMTFHWESSTLKGLWYPLVKAGAAVTAGQELGYVKDLLGEVKQTVSSPSNGIVLFNVSSLAMNEGDPLVAVGEL